MKILSEKSRIRQKVKKLKILMNIKLDGHLSQKVCNENWKIYKILINY